MKEFKFVELIRPYRSLFAGTIIVNITFSLSGLVLPYMLKIAIDRILPNADYELFTILCASMLIVYAIRCIMRYISGYMGTYTTIRMLLGMTRPDGGSLQVLGQPQADKEQIGVVLDEPAFPECLTAKQVGKVMAGIFRSWDKAAYAGYLKKLGLVEEELGNKEAAKKAYTTIAEKYNTSLEARDIDLYIGRLR